MSIDREILGTLVREFPGDDCLWGLDVGSESIVYAMYHVAETPINPKMMRTIIL